MALGSLPARPPGQEPASPRRTETFAMNWQFGAWQAVSLKRYKFCVHKRDAIPTTRLGHNASCQVGLRYAGEFGF